MSRDLSVFASEIVLAMALLSLLVVRMNIKVQIEILEAKFYEAAKVEDVLSSALGLVKSRRPRRPLVNNTPHSRYCNSLPILEQRQIL